MSSDAVNRPEPGAEWSASFAHATVDGMAVYDTIIARLFTPWARDLIERLAPQPGCEALDVAAGPGTVTHLLAERIGQAGRVIATDISPAMLTIAATKPVAPGSASIEWIESPATPLPLPDASVDVVTCQQGLQFFPDKVAALAEIRRVLRRGGRAGIAVWTQVEDQVFGLLRDAIAHVLSADVAVRYLGPFLLSGEETSAAASAAGFEKIDLQTVTLPAVLASGAAELVATLPASGIAADFAALDEATKAELLDETSRLTQPLRDGDAIRSSLTSSVLILS